MPENAEAVVVNPIAFEPGIASRCGGHIYDDGKAGTVRANAGDNQQAVVYGISAYESNAMKSANPNSGVYEAETARTLDLNGGSPACNQGGMAVVCLEGNGSRPSHKGNGFAESDTMYTLNSTEHHAVCIGNGQMRNITMNPVANTLDTMHDQQAVLTINGGKVTPPLDANYYRGCGERNGEEREAVCYAIDRASFNQGKNAQYDFSVQEDLAQTIVAKGPGGVLTKQSEHYAQETTKE